MKEVNRSDAKYNVKQETVNLKKDRNTSRKVFPGLLSSQQKICVLYAMMGLSSKQTAEKMGISYGTVRSYFEVIKRKLNCRSKAKAIQSVIDSNLLNLDTKIISALEREVG